MSRQNILKIGYILFLVLFVIGGIMFADQYVFLKSEHTMPSKFKKAVAQVSPTISIASSSPLSSDFGVLIPSVSINVPVIANVDGRNSRTYLYDLTKGVAQIAPSLDSKFSVQGALPGQGGNVFIFGHSNVPWGSKDEYQSAFSNLKDLHINDIVYVYYKGQKYKYSVFDKEVVPKTDLAVMAATRSETLTLMTCWPLGLDVERLIIKASPA